MHNHYHHHHHVLPQDEMVPFDQMQRLRSVAASPSVTWVEFPDATHMDAYDANAALYWPALSDWLTRLPGCAVAAQ